MSEIVARAVREVQKGAVTAVTGLFDKDPNPKVFVLSEASAREIVLVVISTIREPTEAMWSGLARDLVLWNRFGPTPGGQNGAELYRQLRMIGRPIPGWLLAEIPDNDHVPPKGTVAACIFKAMIDAALEMS